jgi:hypothetical protein
LPFGANHYPRDMRYCRTLCRIVSRVRAGNLQGRNRENQFKIREFFSTLPHAVYVRFLEEERDMMKTDRNVVWTPS